jgi:hypothetical protein
MRSLIVSVLAGPCLLALLAPVAAAGSFPTWDRQINGPGRFAVLAAFNHEAVLDRETGLVWERSPGTDALRWLVSNGVCYDRNVGGRKGWRPARIEELASLVDPTRPFDAVKLPPNHPFLGVEFGSPPTGIYWSGTSLTSDIAGAVSFSSGNHLGANKLDEYFTWCVRGGQGDAGF